MHAFVSGSALVYVRACVRACVRAYVRARVCVCVRVRHNMRIKGLI